MIVLDTNVISESMKPLPHPTVLAWLDSARARGVHTTSTVLGELYLGLAKMPEGARKAQLMVRIEILVARVFRGRVLSFDVEAALRYGVIAAAQESKGRRMSFGDAQIAAVCLSVGATLATRNTKDFEGLGLDLVNPWEANSGAG